MYLRSVIQPGGADANAAEDKLQRQLAKKLGLKSKRGKMGGGDGLDDLVGELDSLGSSDSDGGDSDVGVGEGDSEEDEGSSDGEGDSLQDDSEDEDGRDAFPEDSEDSQDALGSGYLESGSDGGVLNC